MKTNLIICCIWGILPSYVMWELYKTIIRILSLNHQYFMVQVSGRFFFFVSDGKFWAKLAINKFARHCGPIRAEGEIPLGWLRLYPETNQSVTHRPLGGIIRKVEKIEIDTLPKTFKNNNKTCNPRDTWKLTKEMNRSCFSTPSFFLLFVSVPR